MGISNSEAAAQIARLRKREDRACEVCGKVAAMLKRQRYCSDACSLRADYQRHAEQRRANRRARYRRAKGDEG